MRSIAGIHGAAGAFILLVTAALGCWGPPASAPAKREAKEAETIDVAPLAREIYALTLDNKDRCLRVARETVRLYELHKSPMNFDPIHKFLNHDAKPEQAAIAKAADIAGRVLNRVRQAKTPEAVEIAQVLDELLRAQARLCSQTFTATGFQSNYDQRISLAMLELVKQERAVARLVSLSATQRQAVRDTYRTQVAAARQAVHDEFAALGEVAQWRYDHEFLDLTPAEARDREESWRRQQEWLEEQRRQQDVLHREAVDQWRSREPRGTEPKPHLGLVPSKEIGPEGGPPPSAMKAWHADYAERAMPANIALDRLLQVREDVNAPRAERACQSLFGKVSDLLVAARVFDSPDGEAGRHLKEAFTLFRQAAEACMNGDQAETERLLNAGQAALDRAAVALRPYSLAP